MTPGEEFEQWWNEKYTGFSPKTNTTRVIKIMVQQGYLQGREDERRKAEAENKGLRIMISDYQESCKRWEEICLTLEKKLVAAEARVKELEFWYDQFCQMREHAAEQAERVKELEAEIRKLRVQLTEAYYPY